MDLPDWVPINTALFFNPVNWVIVTLMMLMAVILVCLLTGAMGAPKSEEG